MKVSVRKRLGVPAAAVALLAGVAGCQGGDGKKAADAPAGQPQWSSAAQVIQTAYEKTAAAKSAKVRMTMTLPEGVGGAAAGAGEMEMTGVLGWDPGTMDITVTGGGPLGGGEGAADSGDFRMVMVDDVMYMDMGDKAPAELGGKRWMKLDFKALGEKTGDAALQKQLTGSLENMNQDPARQLAVLLGSPSLKHVGPEKVDGVETQHYKGTLSVEEMLDANEALDDLFTEQEREQLVANMKKTGLKGYDTEIWVNEDDYPAKMVVGMTTAQGTMKMTSHFSDYGAEVDVEAPPAGETFDFMEMLKELESLGAGAGSAA